MTTEKQMTPVESAILMTDHASGLKNMPFGDTEIEAMKILCAHLKIDRPNYGQICGIVAAEVRRLSDENVRLEKERDDAIQERKCCHEIYDDIRRSLGYADGVGYPMLAPAVHEIVAEIAQLRTVIDGQKNVIDSRKEEDFA